ncbi:MAG: MerR family transcriptional regulator [Polyangiaceae bacterium]
MKAAPSQLTDKPFFRIGEVARAVGVEPHVLRYWEREFRGIRPQKSSRGQRVYSRRDLDLLLEVRELLYAQGFTIAGAKKQLATVAKAGAAAKPVRMPVAEGVHELPDAPDTETDLSRAVSRKTRAAAAPEPRAMTSTPAAAATAPSSVALRASLLSIRKELEDFLGTL